MTGDLAEAIGTVAEGSLYARAVEPPLGPLRSRPALAR